MSDLRTDALSVNDSTYAAWNAHDAEAVAAVFAPDATTRDVGTPEPSVGRDAIRERAETLLAAFPDFHLERIELVIDGDRHADRWVATGTHQGELQGMAPTGHPIWVEGMTFTRMGSDGLVAEDVHMWDVGTLLAQLGGAGAGEA